MCCVFRPLHLLFLTEAFTHDLIASRFHKAGADPFALPVALAVIRNEPFVVLDIGVGEFQSSSDVYLLHIIILPSLESDTHAGEGG
jgi:hypothetical protein